MPSITPVVTPGYNVGVVSLLKSQENVSCVSCGSVLFRITYSRFGLTLNLASIKIGYQQRFYILHTFALAVKCVMGHFLFIYF